MANIPYFERAWKISVNTQAGETYVLSSSYMDTPLRATFSVKTAIQVPYWEADLVVYNLASQTTKDLTQSPWDFRTPLKLGDGLAISAGYKYSSTAPFDPNSSEIFIGNVFQPIWTRENVVDSKVTLRCLVGLVEDAYNFLNFSMGGNVSQYDLVNRICKEAGVPPASGTSIDQDILPNQKFSRGQTVFCKPFSKLSQIARDNNMAVWLSRRKNSDGTTGYGLNLRSLKTDPNVQPKYTYASPSQKGTPAPQSTPQGIVKRTIIGTPEQTQAGVTFRVLMDSDPLLGDVIRIDPATIIARLPIQIGTLPPVIDSRGLYIISGLNYYGDTRSEGESWYTEIQALSFDFFPSFLSSSAPDTN